MKVAERRDLTDLYARGEELVLGEGDNTRTLWIRKMTPSDAESCYTKASAKRSSVMALARSEQQSDLYDMIVAETSNMAKEVLVNFLATNEISETRPLIDSRISFEEEWAKEHYLDSLRDRFLELDFQKKMLEEPEDEEVTRVWGELERFNDQVEKEVEKERENVVHNLERDDEEDLRKKVIEGMLEVQANAAWLSEFTRCQVWRCSYWGDDHQAPAFPTRADVDKVQGEVLGRIAEVIDRIHVPDAEGKDLLSPEDSSQQSETPEVEETEPPSSPKA